MSVGWSDGCVEAERWAWKMADSKAGRLAGCSAVRMTALTVVVKARKTVVSTVAMTAGPWVWSSVARKTEHWAEHWVEPMVSSMAAWWAASRCLDGTIDGCREGCELGLTMGPWLVAQRAAVGPTGWLNRGLASGLSTELQRWLSRRNR